MVIEKRGRRALGIKIIVQMKHLMRGHILTCRYEEGRIHGQAVTSEASSLQRKASTFPKNADLAGKQVTSEANEVLVIFYST
uniref:Uncharacterized protein n=1 Tax=Strongyloides venezuelensis TaxID=75913 RepID=A0A0K0FBT0_STRVS